MPASHRSARVAVMGSIVAMSAHDGRECGGANLRCGMERHCDSRNASCNTVHEHWGKVRNCIAGALGASCVAPAADALPCALQSGHAPLHLAAHEGKTTAVEVLLQHKADIDAKDKVHDSIQPCTA